MSVALGYLCNTYKSRCTVIQMCMWDGRGVAGIAGKSLYECIGHQHQYFLYVVKTPKLIDSGLHSLERACCMSCHSRLTIWDLIQTVDNMIVLPP